LEYLIKHVMLTCSHCDLSGYRMFRVLGRRNDAKEVYYATNIIFILEG
jgi:hypothetical protein